jgi:hypothetical protein
LRELEKLSMLRPRLTRLLLLSLALPLKCRYP